jgi:hypothetical protein
MLCKTARLHNRGINRAVTAHLKQRQRMAFNREGTPAINRVIQSLKRHTIRATVSGKRDSHGNQQGPSHGAPLIGIEKLVVFEWD